MFTLPNIYTNELQELNNLLTDFLAGGHLASLGGFKIKEADHVLAQSVYDIADDLDMELKAVFYGGSLSTFWAFYIDEDNGGGYFFKPFEEIAECEECGFLEEVENMNPTEEGGLVCEDCCNSYYYYCDNCGKYATETYRVKSGGGDFEYCESCINNDDTVHHCMECGDYFTGDTGIADSYGHALCYDCYEHGSYYICDNCGEIIHEDNATWSGEEVFCRDCRPAFEYKSGITFFDMRENSRLCSFGVEVESGSDSIPNEKMQYFYPTYDGSISGYCYPVEWVSDIFSVKELAEDEELNEDLQKINELFEANGSCGLHVHAGREFFRGLAIEKIKLFIHNNYNSLVHFCRRSKSSANDWCRDGYDIADSGERAQHRTKKAKLQYRSGDRYEALNTTNRKTVELRLFAGSTEVFDIKAAIYFYDAMIQYANTKNFIQVNSANIYKVISDYENKVGRELLLEYYKYMFSAKQ